MASPAHVTQLVISGPPPLPHPSFAHWSQCLPLVPPLLPPDFPSWPISLAGPLPSPGPAPWHSAQLGTCSWNPATLLLCSSREQGAGPGPGGPRVRPGNGGWGLVPPLPPREGEGPPEDLATCEQSKGPESSGPLPHIQGPSWAPLLTLSWVLGVLPEV